MQDLGPTLRNLILEGFIPMSHRGHVVLVWEEFSTPNNAGDRSSGGTTGPALQHNSLNHMALP